MKMETQGFLVLLLCSGALGCQYSRAVTIDAPNLEALSGTCLLIPCSFNVAIEYEDKLDLNQRVEAIWSKTHPDLGRPGDPVSFNAWTSFPFSMEMIGNLRQKNCTTLFSDMNTVRSDQYYLRIENYKFKGTALCDPLHITVQESPWTPSVQVTQREQDTVTITCSAPAPCPQAPPKLTWSLQPEPPHSTDRNSDGNFSTSEQHMDQNSDGTFSTSVQLQMRLSEQHHGLKVNCSAVYPVTGGQKRAEGSISLSVEYANVRIGPYTVLKICGVVVLFCALLLIECLAKKRVTQSQQRPEDDYVNCVEESSV